MSQISMFCVLYVERHKNSDMEKQHLKKLYILLYIHKNHLQQLSLQHLLILLLYFLL